MELIKPKVEILYCDNSLLKLIEKAGRTCYKSEHKISDSSYQKFIKNIINSGHESVIEHSLLTVKFICDRGISHEIVRHRLAAYSQESTRYVNYYKRGLRFIIPFWYKNLYDNIDKINDCLKVNWNVEQIAKSCNLTEVEQDFLKYLLDVEKMYNKLINTYGQKPQEARTVLPNCVATELVMSANFREWRHVIKLRSSKAAHPQIREPIVDLYNILRLKYPEIFSIVFERTLENS
jgi:thymidylate synthase (FAD)